MKKEFIEKNQKNIVFLGLRKTVPNGQMINIRGSGVIVNPLKVITNAHVYNEIPESERDSIFCAVMTEDNGKLATYTFLKARYVDKVDGRDIALFEIEDPNSLLNDYGVASNAFANEEEIDKLYVTDPLYFLGFPLANELWAMGMGITLSASQCILGSKKYSNADNKIDFILIDKQVNLGSSGSPVFNDKGKIIGIASGNLDKTHKIGENLINVPVSIGIVRPSNYVIELLNNNN